MHKPVVRFGILLLAIVILAGCTRKSSTVNTATVTNSNTVSNANVATNTSSQLLVWQQRESGWEAVSTPPACPDPLVLDMPVDLDLVTTILYPGQTRGGDYKPHGGFRFDDSDNGEVAVTVPMDAYVVAGSRYLEDGDVQYAFDLIAPCGIMVRFDHLLELDPAFAVLTNDFPPAEEGDSRTTSVEPAVFVHASDLIATAVGFRADTNTFVDWGVYDLRSNNEVSENAAWAASHTSDLERHAVCWFDLLSVGEESRVRSLPAADSTSGKTSDYCT